MKRRKIPLASEFGAILELVCNIFGVRANCVVSRSKVELHTAPRAVAVTLMREFTAAQNREIAALFDRHYTTVRNCVRYVRTRQEIDKSFARKMAELRAQLR